MNVKTFTGSNTKEIIAQIKAEMGSEAVILSTRDYKQNNKKIVEITAGVDRQTPQIVETNNLKQKDTNQVFNNGYLNDWQKEWLKIKDHIYALMQNNIDLNKLSQRAKVAIDYLQKEGTNEEIIIDIYNKLIVKPNMSPLHLLSELMPTKSYNLMHFPEHIHVICGPAGAGKTSTILRLAMQAKLENPEVNIAFINTDIARANGRLVLKHWTELSNFNYSEAHDKKSLTEALTENQFADLVYIDLASLNAEEDLQSVLVSLGLNKMNVSSHLVVSPYYNNIQSHKFIEQYKVADSIILTKLDEFDSYGSLINFCINFNKPISALSYGSEIKNSLREANDEDIWKLIFKKIVK